MLVNNAVYGKTMENVRKHSDIKIVIKTWNLEEFVIKTKLSCNIFIFKKNLSAIEIKKKTHKYSKISQCNQAYFYIFHVHIVAFFLL